MTEENSMSNWFQDNLRIIISVGIVILLVFAIYSYSKRNSRTNIIVDDSQIEEVAMTAGDGSSQEINEIIDEIKDEEAQKDSTVAKKEVTSKDESAQEEKAALDQKIAEEAQREKAKKEVELALAAKTADQQKQAEQQKLEVELAEQEKQAEKEKQEKTEQEKQSAKDAVREVIESRSGQKEGVLVVVAVPQDSATTLARKATAEYIRKNNVSGLTPAHKIYIEDYMRKATTTPKIHPGTEMEFSYNLINAAVESARTLTDAQLHNLDKYAQNVSTL